MRAHSLRSFLIVLSVGVGAAVAAASGCSAANDGPSEFGGGGSSNSGNGPATTTTTTGVGGGDIISGVGGGSNPCGQSCSSDLKKIIDCNGGVIKECSGDQACSNGACVNDPCKAAADAKSSYGCDYWALRTELIAEGSGACFAAFVANTWSVPVHLGVEYGGQNFEPAAFTRIPVGQGKSIQYVPYDPQMGLPPGEVAILFLAQGTPGLGSFMPPCPVPAAVASDAQVNGTGRGKAFHITSDRPVVAYQILPYGGGSAAATSATLLLPTSAWDTNYIAVNAYKASQAAPGAFPSLDILAYEDGTEVTVLPKVPIQGGAGVPASGPGQPVKYSLSRGEYVQITQELELTGSPVQANKPVGVWGAATCLNVPVDATACDSAQQQIPPVKALGSEYAAVRYRGRAGQDNEAPPWRVVGAVDGTQLQWEPPQPGAPNVVNLGDVYEFNSAGPFVVRSQDKDHPFYFAGYMTGGDAFGGEGDPEWVNVIPTAQYLNSYVLFTDPTYSETELVVVRRPGPNKQFADVTLDCLGVVSGWQPVGEYEWARVDLVTGNFQNVGNCSNGRHEMKSDLPFGVTVWGWGNIPGFPGAGDSFTQYVSYAYPAGVSVQSINDVVVPTVPK